MLFLLLLVLVWSLHLVGPSATSAHRLKSWLGELEAMASGKALMIDSDEEVPPPVQKSLLPAGACPAGALLGVPPAEFPPIVPPEVDAAHDAAAHPVLRPDGSAELPTEVSPDSLPVVPPKLLPVPEGAPPPPPADDHRTDPSEDAAQRKAVTTTYFYI